MLDLNLTFEIWHLFIYSFVSIAALGFSALSLWLATDQSKKIVEHNKISVMPLLGLNVIQNNNKIFLTEVKNNGLGTAIIESLTVFMDGVQIENKNAILTALDKIFDESRYDIEAYGMIENTNDSANFSKDQSFGLFKIEGKDGNEITQQDIKSLKRIVIEIRYKSLYGEKGKLCSTRHISEWL